MPERIHLKMISVPKPKLIDAALHFLSVASGSLGPFFGYFPEMFGGKPCECPAPPAACPATTQPATITVPTASCMTNFRQRKVLTST